MRYALGGSIFDGMSRGFFDAASGHPLHPAARHAFAAFADRSWSDPQSAHYEGRRASQLLEAARETVARTLGVEPPTVSFRHAEQDAADHAVLGVARGQAHNNRSRCVVVSAVERQAILDAADRACEAGAVRVPVGPTGAIDLVALHDAIAPRPLTVVVQAANAEVGTRQPVEAVAAACRSADVPLVMDATGSIGFDEPPTGWDVLLADAMSWGGPRDLGILAVRSGTSWRSIDPSRSDARPTDIADIAAAAAAAAALDAVEAARSAESARLRQLVDKIRRVVTGDISDVVVVGDPIDRLPQIVTFSFLYADGQVIASDLDQLGFAVGCGSPCAATTGLASHVLAAIGTLAQGNVRLSLPLGCPAEDVDRLLAVLPGVVSRHRQDLGVTDV